MAEPIAAGSAPAVSSVNDPVQPEVGASRGVFWADLLPSHLMQSLPYSPVHLGHCWPPFDMSIASAWQHQDKDVNEECR